MAGRDTVENVDVTLTATDKASDVIEKVGSTLDDQIPDRPVDVTVTADDQASDDLRDVGSTADEAARQRELTIRGAGLGDILDDLRGIQTEAGDAAGQVEDIGTAAEGAGGVTADGMGKATGALQQLPGPIGDIAGAFSDAADAASSIPDKVGGIGGALSGLTPILGVVGGAVLEFWNLWKTQADDAKKKLDEVKQAQLDMAKGDVLSSTKLLTDQYQQYGDALQKAGISMGTYTQIVTGKLTLDDAISQGLADQNSKLFLQGTVLDENSSRWKEANADLLTQQTRQFEAAKAIGATTDQMLDLASTSLKPVSDQVLEYVASVNGIPESKMTAILTDADPDDVAQVKKILDDLAKSRQQTTTAEADTGSAEADLNQTARARTATITVKINQQGGVGSVPYGPNLPGTSAVPTVRGRMVGVGATPTAGPLGFAPMPVGGNSYTVNVYMPLGSPTAAVGQYVTDAIDAFERRNGNRRRPT